MEKHLHIISFDVPYPANYGGVIDVFYKIKNLHKAGVKIILHCFEYGRGEQKELEKYCYKVNYYKRHTSFIKQLSSIPFIIRSRDSELLMHNLLKDSYPILFEGLHTCYYIGDKQIAARKKIYRESNIEHEYYLHLAKSEKSFWKKAYFMLEAKKLFAFQKQLAHANLMLIVSTADRDYLQQQFPAKKIEYLPSFHGFEEVNIREGKGSYILYHGNLQVAENTKAIAYLVEHVFAKINYPVIIAGLNPGAELYKQVQAYKHIQIKPNPTETEMNTLVQDAHIHVLYTHQPTGLKLKLVNVLYSGRFCICNQAMLTGTDLQGTCMVKDTAGEMIEAINDTFQQEFTQALVSLRKQALQAFDNERKTRQLISYL